MHVLITGAAGFLGQRLTRTLLERGEVNGKTLTRLTLIDQVAPVPPSHDTVRLDCRAMDITRPGALDSLLGERPEVIYHLAAVVSAAAEADLDLGMTVNFDATRALLEGCRAAGLAETRLIMASSVAVYGGELPDTLDDMTALTPQSSYGTQKAMCELLINDYSRRGLVDGCVLRLPTIVVRPGKPNAAASSFASSILREPLNGEAAVCPVPTDLDLFVMSPGRVIDALLHAATLPGEALAPYRSVMLPGLTVSVAAMLEVLREVGGEEALARVSHEPDPRIEAIVASWPARFETHRAERLGFAGDGDFHEIVRTFIAEQNAS
ncbi:nucleoside-diphosphate-sugar epimerase [Modicisalibacter xianhensis]|uniref:Nucleoside-diphosphate-sugar epimerase n=1 Tax=Modicisalibacter xianhensis TaxID=442341 RepID=A0A4R8FXB0_9GAMM|nr:D-erythronate dehydrogenase [Halomonas xianhensis]TDX31601.1 nucleoside-diphosphate-sugar epimerase [Halomonas xianhensis]